MGESYDDLTDAVNQRWVAIRNQLDGVAFEEILDFILTELESNDLKSQILDKKAEKTEKIEEKVTRNLKKEKISKIREKYRKVHTKEVKNG